VSTDTSDDGSDAAVEPRNDFFIPAMLTTSAAEVLHHFGDDIIELSARASQDTENAEELKRDYGLMRRQLQRETVTLEFSEQSDVHGEPLNPLTDSAAKEILNQTRFLLNTDRDSVEADLSVTKLVVRAELPELREVTRAQSDEFELTFISDRVLKDEMNRKTQEANLGKGLFETLGWEYRNLNLHQAVEARAKYTEQYGDGQVMSWGGPEDTRGRCSRDAAEAVMDTVLPDGFSCLKGMYIDSANQVELASARFDSEVSE
jgi:hypothetical protein